MQSPLAQNQDSTNTRTPITDLALKYVGMSITQAVNLFVLSTYAKASADVVLKLKFANLFNPS